MGRKPDENSEWGGRGVVEEGDKIPATIARPGRTPSEVQQMAEDLSRLEEYVEEAVAEAKITYKGKRLTKEDVLTIVKMLVVNRSNDEICDAVNQMRSERGDRELTRAEIGVWRFRGRYKKVILDVRKFIFQSMPDIFEYTNPVYVVAKVNHVLNYLYYLGVETGLKEGEIDRNTQSLVKLWFQGIRQLNQIISINIEQIETEQEKDDKVDVVAFLKNVRKKFGSDVSEQELIDHFFKERYEGQLHSGGTNENTDSDKTEN